MHLPCKASAGFSPENDLASAVALDNLLPVPTLMKLRRAFTLVELLAVMAVIAIVIAFAVPAATQIMRGSQLTQGSQQLADQLGYARQIALSRNRPIEVRFYRFGDPETPGEDAAKPETGKWRAFQLFEQLENGAVLPVGPMQRLPRMVVMDGDKYSTLIKAFNNGTPILATSDPTVPELPVEVGMRKVGRNYQYVNFQFRPDGSTNLPTEVPQSANDTWHLTLVNLTDENREISKVNYFTVQVDPVSGTLKTFRPTAG
jgi:uncharacterized protein (TIGR02596 family)